MQLVNDFLASVYHLQMLIMLNFRNDLWPGKLRETATHVVVVCLLSTCPISKCMMPRWADRSIIAHQNVFMRKRARSSYCARF